MTVAKEKLSDLDYGKDIDFTINIDTVKNAWKSLKQDTDDKWSIINFMPAYNGIPEDFDSSKLLMDMSSTNLTKTKTEDGKTYKTKEGWVMAELPDEMTEWETRDLRSYLQRPCIRMKEIIKACCNPLPIMVDMKWNWMKISSTKTIWEDTWMSLPMIQTLEYDSGEQAIEGATLMTKTTEGNKDICIKNLNLIWESFPTSSMYLYATINPNLSYPSTSYKWFWNSGDSYHSGWAC